MTLLFSMVEFQAVIQARKKLEKHITRRILVCITKDIEDPTHYSHFKYYIMDFDEDNSVCYVKYGRIGASPQLHQYEYWDGNKKMQEKLRKGYRELTSAEYEAGFGQYGNLQI